MLINFAKMMVNRMNQENQGNRHFDWSFDGTLMALVLASISVGIVLALEIGAVATVFLFFIGIIVDLSAVIIGFIEGTS